MDSDFDLCASMSLEDDSTYLVALNDDQRLVREDRLGCNLVGKILISKSVN